MMRLTGVSLPTVSLAQSILKRQGGGEESVVQQSPLPLKTVSAKAGHYAGQILSLNKVRFASSVIQKENIPVVDFAQFVSGNPVARAEFVKTLGDGMREYGFVAVKNHGIDTQLFKQNYDEMQKVFALDPATKKKYHHPEIGSQRGYQPLKSELKGATFDQQNANKNRADLKENWHAGRYHNVFPAEVPTYEPVSMQLFGEMDKLGSRLLEALGEYLGDSGYLKSLVQDDQGKLNGTHLMRSIHYPPVPDEDLNGVDLSKPFLRAAAHNDMNLITLLPESTNAGLEILRRDGSWLGVHGQDGHIIMNAGDMLAAITEGHPKSIPSTRHQVVGDASTLKQTRLSIPMFIHPYHDKPLQNLVTGQNIRYKFADQEIECRDATEYVYNRLKKHGTGTMSGGVTYEQFKAENRHLVHGD